MSLGVIASAALVAFGLERADPVVGILITVVILRITWMRGALFARLNPARRSTGTSSIEPASTAPTEAQAFRFWLRLGMISFGGPAGQIAIMHDELVEKRRWISSAASSTR